MERIPNLIELGRRPDDPRYVWILKTGNGQIRQGSTWITLKRALDEVEIQDFEVILVDLKDYDCTALEPDEMEGFMQHWRENYWDTEYRLYTKNP